ncbi:MAG: dihydroxyacetone kinase subunit DhaL [Clostridiales bacterium]|nr:dihydroxyacetone kinase subunit DhaL [Clostridiales bacterium]
MKTQKEFFFELLEKICNRLIESEKLLTELDSAIGDGDCGIGIKSGFQEVLFKLCEWKEKSIGDILKQTGLTLSSTIGGTSGAIFGTGFMRIGGSLSNKVNITFSDIQVGLDAALDGMKMRGEGTQVGDKTLIDALEPAVREFGKALSEGKSAENIVNMALSAARTGSDSTINLIAKRGRASYLGERSIGHRDAGSMVICLIIEAVYEYLYGLWCK